MELRAVMNDDMPWNVKLSALYFIELVTAGQLAGLRVPPVNQRSVRSI